jgi:hypothetical protein
MSTNMLSRPQYVLDFPRLLSHSPQITYKSSPYYPFPVGTTSWTPERCCVTPIGLAHGSPDFHARLTLLFFHFLLNMGRRYIAVCNGPSVDNAVSLQH